jgi:hypothetical protein
MKLRLKRISPASLAAILAGIYFAAGLLVSACGVVLALSGAPFTLIGPVTYGGQGPAMLAMLAAYPFILALLGLITGFLSAWFYNAVARLTRGVLVEFTEAGRLET